MQHTTCFLSYGMPGKVSCLSLIHRGTCCWAGSGPVFVKETDGKKAQYTSLPGRVLLSGLSAAVASFEVFLSSCFCVSLQHTSHNLAHNSVQRMPLLSYKNNKTVSKLVYRPAVLVQQCVVKPNCLRSYTKDGQWRTDKTTQTCSNLVVQ